MKISRFAPQPNPVRHPKTLTYAQREIAGIGGLWLAANGYSPRTGLEFQRRNAASVANTPAMRSDRSCKTCASLMIDGTCTLDSKH